MHQSSLLRMQWFEKNYAPTTGIINVLDVGSCDVNGSYRNVFSNKKYLYTGLDIEKGRNVDYIPSAPYDWKELQTDSFDIVISGQALEHIEFFWLTLAEMTRILKKDGLLCIVAPRGFGEHRHPVDCYRFFTDGMVALARYVNLIPLHAHTNKGPASSPQWYSNDCADSMLIAKKPYSGVAKLIDPQTYKCVPPDQGTLSSDLIRFP